MLCNNSNNSNPVEVLAQSKEQGGESSLQNPHQPCDQFPDTEQQSLESPARSAQQYGDHSDPRRLTCALPETHGSSSHCMLCCQTPAATPPRLSEVHMPTLCNPEPASAPASCPSQLIPKHQSTRWCKQTTSPFKKEVSICQSPLCLQSWLWKSCLKIRFLQAASQGIKQCALARAWWPQQQSNAARLQDSTHVVQDPKFVLVGLHDAQGL